MIREYKGLKTKSICSGLLIKSAFIILLSAQLTQPAHSSSQLHQQVLELNQQANTLIYENPQQAIKLIEHGLELLKQQPDFDLYYVLNITLSDIYVQQDKYQQAQILLQHLLDHTSIQPHADKQAQALSRRGEIYWYQGDIYQAVDNLEKSLNLYRAANKPHDIAIAQNNLGIIHRHLGNYEQALDYLLKSLATKESLDIPGSVASTLNNIGVVYYYLKQYEKAILYYNKSIEVYQSLGSRIEQADPINNKGQALEKLGQFEQAIEHYESSLSIEQEINNKRGQGFSHATIGAVLIKQERLAEAQLHLEKAHQLGIASQATQVQSEALFQLGQLHIKLDDMPSAIETWKSGLTIAENTSEKEKVMRFHQHLAEAYESSNQYKSALHHFKHYKNVAEELLGDNQVNNVKRVEFQNKLLKKDQQISELDAQLNRKAIEHHDLESWFFVTLVITVCLALLLILLIAYLKKSLKANNESFSWSNQKNTPQQQYYSDENLSKQISNQLSNQLANQLSKQKLYDRLLKPLQAINHISHDLHAPDRQPLAKDQIKSLLCYSVTLNIHLRNLILTMTNRIDSLCTEFSFVKLDKLIPILVDVFHDNLDDLSINFINNIQTPPDVWADENCVNQVIFNITDYLITQIGVGTLYFDAYPSQQQLMIRISNAPLSKRVRLTENKLSNSTTVKNSSVLALSETIILQLDGDLWLESSSTQSGKMEYTACFTLPLKDSDSFNNIESSQNSDTNY